MGKEGGKEKAENDFGGESRHQLGLHEAAFHIVYYRCIVSDTWFYTLPPPIFHRFPSGVFGNFPRQCVSQRKEPSTRKMLCSMLYANDSKYYSGEQIDIGQKLATTGSILTQMHQASKSGTIYLYNLFDFVEFRSSCIHQVKRCVALRCNGVNEAWLSFACPC